MYNYLKIIILFGLLLFSCASHSKSAKSKQENFIYNHPIWRGHNFNFSRGNLKTNILKVIEAIKHEQKIQSVQDSIFLKMKKKYDSTI